MDIQTIVAAAIFAAAIILLISMMKKKLVHGGSCCGDHEAPEPKVKVKDKKISHYDYHYEASIEGMVCSNCATRVENALNKNEGIYAKADLGNKKAVIHAKRALSKEEVLGYLKELPYTIMSFDQGKRINESRKGM